GRGGRYARRGTRRQRTAGSWRGSVPFTHLAREGRMTVTIGRRELLLALGGAAAAWPLAAGAQQTNRRTRPVLGYLVTGTHAGFASLTTPFLNRLREIGFTDGRNIDIITRYADADITRLSGLADELVRLQPDVIVAIDPPAALAAKKATASLPIVAAILNDPVRLGMIESYARPGGNVTGILSQVEGLPGKQVEIAGAGAGVNRSRSARESGECNPWISATRDRNCCHEQRHQDRRR